MKRTTLKTRSKNMKRFYEMHIEKLNWKPWMPVLLLSMAFVTLAGCGSSKGNSPTSPGAPKYDGTATTALAHTAGGNQSFSFHAESIGGTVSLTGGGVFDRQSGFVKGGGGFRCTQDITGGPLTGCKTGEGVRWSAEQILPSSGFKCSASDPAKTAVTDDNTLVMQVNFYRQGDGVNASFTAKMFVSAEDENPDEDGVQNIWIQGVGCDGARVNLR
jgi:hypothetical protein